MMDEESDDSSEVEDDANDVSRDVLSDGDVEEGDESDDVQIDNEDEVEDTFRRLFENFSYCSTRKRHDYSFYV